MKSVASGRVPSMISQFYSFAEKQGDNAAPTKAVETLKIFCHV